MGLFPFFGALKGHHEKEQIHLAGELKQGQAATQQDPTLMPATRECCGLTLCSKDTHPVSREAPVGFPPSNGQVSLQMPGALRQSQKREFPGGSRPLGPGVGLSSQNDLKSGLLVVQRQHLKLGLKVAIYKKAVDTAINVDSYGSDSHTCHEENRRARDI